MNELEAALAQVAALTNVPSLVAVRIEPHTLPEALRPAPVAKGMMMSAGDDARAKRQLVLRIRKVETERAEVCGGAAVCFSASFKAMRRTKSCACRSENVEAQHL
ncbi:MAG: hypothetical protein WBW03_27695, partial [Silvibacterium sp.]